MRQDDEMFINLLNKMQVGQIGQNTKHVIKSRFTGKDDTSYPGNVCIFFQKMPQLKDTRQMIETYPRKANHNTCER